MTSAALAHALKEYAALDDLLTHIGDTADRRLTFQAAPPIHGWGSARALRACRLIGPGR